MLKIMNKNLNAFDWIEVVDNLNIGDKNNKDFLKSFVAIALPSDFEVPKD